MCPRPEVLIVTWTGLLTLLCLLEMLVLGQRQCAAQWHLRCLPTWASVCLGCTFLPALDLNTTSSSLLPSLLVCRIQQLQQLLQDTTSSSASDSDSSSSSSSSSSDHHPRKKRKKKKDKKKKDKKKSKRKRKHKSKTNDSSDSDWGHADTRTWVLRVLHKKGKRLKCSTARPAPWRRPHKLFPLRLKAVYAPSMMTSPSHFFPPPGRQLAFTSSLSAHTAQSPMEQQLKYECVPWYICLSKRICCMGSDSSASMEWAFWFKRMFLHRFW